MPVALRFICMKLVDPCHVYLLPMHLQLDYWRVNFNSCIAQIKLFRNYYHYFYSCLDSPLKIIPPVILKLQINLFSESF